jgi:endonuclease/exonuclease/phosphatase (EEP) superfamily protein YafD
MRRLAKFEPSALAGLEHAAGPWPNWLLRLALAVLAAAAILHFSSARTWPLELAHHFVPQYGLVAVGVAAASLLLRRRRQSVAAMLLAGCFGLVHWTAPMPRPAHFEAAAAVPGETRAAEAAESAGRITLITNNVFVLNKRSEDLMKWLASRPADVIALQEVNGRLTDLLRAGEDGYPYRLVAEDELVTRDGWPARESIVILSRYPILEHRLLQPWAKAWQVALARLNVAEGLRPWIVAIHAPSPVYPDNLPVRHLIYEKLTETIAGLDGPVIVVGDFNATPYTPVYRDFVEAAGLATFRHFPASYPAGLGGFGIPIDHVLARGARLAELQALPPIGSDHRPLTATFIFPGDEP